MFVGLFVVWHNSNYAHPLCIVKSLFTRGLVQSRSACIIEAMLPRKQPSRASATPEEISAVMAELGSRGGANSRKNLTPAKRKKLAQKAARARWGNGAK